MERLLTDGQGARGKVGRGWKGKLRSPSPRSPRPRDAPTVSDLAASDVRERVRPAVAVEQLDVVGPPAAPPQSRACARGARGAAGSRPCAGRRGASAGTCGRPRRRPPSATTTTTAALRPRSAGWERDERADDADSEEEARPRMAREALVADRRVDDERLEARQRRARRADDGVVVQRERADVRNPGQDTARRLDVAVVAGDVLIGAGELWRVEAVAHDAQRSEKARLVGRELASSFN